MPTLRLRTQDEETHAARRMPHRLLIELPTTQRAIEWQTTC